MDLKEYIIQHVSLYCQEKSLAITEEKIITDLDVFLDRISAPKNLYSLYFVFELIRRLYEQTEEVGVILQHLLKLEDYIFISFKEYNIFIDNKDALRAYTKSSITQNWCQTHPFYTLLIQSWNYKSDIVSNLLFISFIKQYFETLHVLTDPRLATKTMSREGESCNAIRLLLLKNNKDFIASEHQIINSLTDQPVMIAHNLEVLLESKRINYIKTIVHFFYNDWAPAKSRTPNKNNGPRYRNSKKNTDNFDVSGADGDMCFLIKKNFNNDITDVEGIVAEDIKTNSTFILLDTEHSQKKDKSLLSDPSMVFSKAQEKRVSINISSQIKRSHNITAQSTQLLGPAELIELVASLIKYSTKSETRDSAAIAWIMLLLNKTITEIKALRLFFDLKNKKTGLYVDEHGRGWWYFPITETALRRIDQKGLKDTEKNVFTPCPDFLVKILINIFECNASNEIFSHINEDEFKLTLTRKLKKISEKQDSGRVSIKNISHFLSTFIHCTNCIDPIFLDFSYSVKLSSTRVTRSYSNIDNEHRCRQLKKLWDEVESLCFQFNKKPLPVTLFELPDFDVFPEVLQRNNSLGSTFTPTNGRIRELVSHLSEQVMVSVPSKRCSLNELINHHNHFTVYTAWMLLFATGYRASWNPLPTLSLYLPRYNLMSISDKDDALFSHSRIVAVPSELVSQLDNYIVHLQTFRSQIRLLEPEIASQIDDVLNVDETVLSLNSIEFDKWYRDIRKSHSKHGPLFLIESIGNTYRATSLSPKLLKEFVPSFNNLPINAGRHWLKSSLLARNVDSELINFQMGHAQIGELPLGSYSALCHLDVINALLPTLDTLLEEVQWKTLKSALI